MNQSPQVPQTRFASIRIIFLAFLMGQVLFLLVAVYMGIIAHEPGKDSFGVGFGPESDWLVLIVCGLAAGVVVSLANGLYFMRLRHGRRLHSVQAKLLHYLSACIIRMAMLEGAGLFVSVFILITGNKWLLLLSIGTLGAFLLSHPNKRRFGAAYNIPPRELDELT